MIATFSMGARLRVAAAAALCALSFLCASAAQATKIERVVSPGGIEAWLVRETSLPVIAIEFAFHGGANQDPADPQARLFQRMSEIPRLRFS